MIQVNRNIIIAGAVALVIILFIFIYRRYRGESMSNNPFTCDRACVNCSQCEVDAIEDEERRLYKSGTSTDDLLIKNMNLNGKRTLIPT